MITVVAYFTAGTAYEREVVLLTRSLERAGMAHRVESIRDRGSWDANTAEKVHVISRAREEIAGPLLYVDADAFVHENCEGYFDALTCDFAAHWFAGPAKGHVRSDVCGCVAGGVCTKPHRFLSGTMYFGDTDGARHLLRCWADLNEFRQRMGHLDGGGQRNLWATLETIGHELDFVKMPGRYCYVFDKPWAYPTDEPCIIEHTIASRENPGRVTTDMGRRHRIRQLRKLVA